MYGIMNRTVVDTPNNKKNYICISVIGMPGSGKTSLGYNLIKSQHIQPKNCFFMGELYREYTTQSILQKKQLKYDKKILNMPNPKYNATLLIDNFLENLENRNYQQYCFVDYTKTNEGIDTFINKCKKYSIKVIFILLDGSSDILNKRLINRDNSNVLNIQNRLEYYNSNVNNMIHRFNTKRYNNCVYFDENDDYKYMYLNTDNYNQKDILNLLISNI
jgi:adenylate kinase family enzyme